MVHARFQNSEAHIPTQNEEALCFLQQASGGNGIKKEPWAHCLQEVLNWILAIIDRLSQRNSLVQTSLVISEKQKLFSAGMLQGKKKSGGKLEIKIISIFNSMIHSKEGVGYIPCANYICKWMLFEDCTQLFQLQECKNLAPFMSGYVYLLLLSRCDPTWNFNSCWKFYPPQNKFWGEEQLQLQLIKGFIKGS